MAPMAFFMALWPDSLECYWWKASQPTGHKAVEKALGATFHIGPKGLFYGLVARFSRILLVGNIPANRATRPLKRSLEPLFTLAPRASFMALWPDSLWWRGLVGSVPANHQSGHKAIEKSLKATS